MLDGLGGGRSHRWTYGAAVALNSGFVGHRGPKRPRVEHTKFCLKIYLPSKDMSSSKFDSIGKLNSGYPQPLSVPF